MAVQVRISPNRDRVQEVEDAGSGWGCYYGELVALWTGLASCESGGWMGEVGWCAVVVFGAESGGCVGWVLLEVSEMGWSWIGSFLILMSFMEVWNLFSA